MNKDQHYFDELAQKLLDLKKRKKKEVIWELDKEDEKFISIKLGYPVEHYLYTIKTKTFKNFRNLPDIIKVVHSASKNNKTTIVRYLNKKDIEDLIEYGVHFKPRKSRIILNKKSKKT